MRRLMPAALGLITAALPLFPSFITLTGVAFPGVDIFGRPVIFAVLGMCCVLAIYAIAMLARYPQHGAQPLLLPLATVVAAGFVAGMLGFDPGAGLLFTGIGALGVIWHCSVMRFLPRSRRCDDAAIGLPHLKRRRGGRRDRYGRHAAARGAVRYRARPRNRHVHLAG